VVGEGLGSLAGPMGIQACFSSIQDVLANKIASSSSGSPCVKRPCQHLPQEARREILVIREESILSRAATD